MGKFFSAIRARLSEPSTHAAIAGILAAIIPLIPPPYQAIAQGLAVLFGGFGVVKGEQKADGYR